MFITNDSITVLFFFFSSRRRHTRSLRDWSSDVCSSDLGEHLEVEIDEKCLQVLATRQPAARDLRFITLALKIVTDLERIGDQCAAIARRALELSMEPPLKPYIDLPRMAQA